SSRGTVIAAYVTIIYLAITAGQFLLGAGEEPSTPFLVAAIFFALAVVPVALTRSAAPAPIAVVRFEPARLWRLSPVGIVGTGVNGMMMSVFYALAPTYALSRGIDGAALPLFTGASLLAGAAMQVPVGRLSDRMDRRLVILGLCLVSAIACAALAIATRETVGFAGLLAIAVVFGAATMPGYAVAAAHAFDYAEPERYVQVSAGLLLSNGVGAAISPLLAGAVMASLGAGAAFGTLGVIALAFMTFVGIRIFRRDALSSDAKDDFTIAVSAPINAVVPPQPVEAHPLVTTPERDAPGVLETWLADPDEDDTIALS
ncbi:MAG: MFS transporter, partial [Pseudomonadota bacterium]